MPPHRYISKDVLFDDEEEWNNKITKYDVYGRLKTIRERNQELLKRKEQVLDSTRETTQSAIKLLKETEAAGISAASELQRQGDALRKTTETLEHMQADLNVNEQHLSGIESVFKTIKKHITRKSKKLRKSFKKKSKTTEDTKATDILLTNTNVLERRPSTQIKDKNQMIEEDLEEIASSISRLKHIGVAMEQEIGAQNKLLDVIQLKVDNTDVTINDQKNRIVKLI